MDRRNGKGVFTGTSHADSRNGSQYEQRERERQRDRKRYDETNNSQRHVSVPDSMTESSTNVQQSVRADDNNELAAPSPAGTASAAELKKQERLKKLEAWKKKQQDRKKAQKPRTGPSPEPTTVTKAKPKKLIPTAVKPTSAKGRFKPLKKPIKINSLFDNTEDEEASNNTKSLFKPNSTAANNIEEENLEENATIQHNGLKVGDEVDPLDAFMNELDSTPSPGKLVPQVAAINDESQDVDMEGSAEADDNEAVQLLKKLRKNKTKDIHVPKYDLKTMEKFPKNFHVRLESVDPDEVINFRVMNSIFISDKKIDPVMNFFHFGLDAQTINIITNELKFSAPTPIQSQTIPAIMSGSDVIGIGKTGSGKTMCYLLGMLKHITQQRPLGDGETGPLGIILSPTRELAIQIYETAEIFIRDNGMKAICCTGGSELNKQIKEIKKGVEIIIATPGRFIDLLTLNNGKLLKTDRITFVTLDEADRLFDLGFEPQINQIMKTIRPDKQCVLFSATFPNKLQQFAVKILHRPVIIGVGNRQVVNENITQQGKVFPNEDEKFSYLLQLLGKQGDQKTIIFCDSQLQVNFMNRRLLDKGYKPVAIHAGLPAHERTTNLSNFRKSSNANILICTEVLSRGLDVPDVKLVILYNAARSFAQYVHTTGRTARGGNTGTAISLLSDDEELQAYILYKCMPDGEVPDEIKDLALSFEKDLKSGKKKISSGFGGKGLDNLDKLRDQTEKTERKKFGEDDEEEKKNNYNEINHSDYEGDEKEEEVVGPNLDITFNAEEGRGPDSGIFNAKININDLPQNVRWIASNNTSLTKIIEATSVSITYKGRFYAEGQEPKPGDEPKLYLLIESEKEHQLIESIEILKRIIVEELKKANNDRSGKYSL